MIGRKNSAAAFVATKPTVNLLSSEVREILRVRALRQRFVVLGALVAVIVGGLFAGQQGLILAADHALAAQNAELADLQAQKKALDPVATFYSDVSANQAAIQEAMLKEVLFSRLLERLSSTAPQGVVLGNVSLIVDTAAATDGTPSNAAQCPGPDPFTENPAVGCVTVVGLATSREAVGALINSLNATDEFVNAFVSATTVTDDGGVAFNATVGLTEQVYSNRYQDIEFLKGVTK